MAQKRKDKNRVVLRSGEGMRTNGTYYFSWRDKNSQRHYIYAKTLNDLREKEKDIDEASKSFQKEVNKKLRLNELYDQWKSLKKGLKPNTFENYCYSYESYVRNTLGKKYVHEIKKSDVKKFYINLYDVNNLSLSYVDSIHTVVRQIFDMAVDDELILKNPTEGVLKEMKKMMDARTQDKPALTIDEQQAFLNYVKDHPTYGHWYPLFAVMLFTGMRIGEVAGLRWEDVDLDEGVIDVNHTLVYFCERTANTANKCKYIINTPKTKSGYRQIPISHKVEEALRLQREYISPEQLDANFTVDGYTDFIFLNRFGEGLHQSTVNKAIKRILRDYNSERTETMTALPHFSCHTTRHTFATRTCEAGINIKAMQEILGHADVRTTLGIYTDATKAFKHSQMETFDQFMENY